MKRRLLTALICCGLVLTLACSLASCQNNANNNGVQNTDSTNSTGNTDNGSNTDKTDESTSCEHKYDNSCDAICNVCGATRSASHDTEEDDGDCTTAIVCPTCGEVLTSGKTQHIAHADDGDCTTPVTCTECTTVITEAKSHDFSGSWEKDVSGHWHVCANEGCTKTDTRAEHISSGAATESAPERCTVCDYIIAPELEHIHEYNIPSKDSNNHWNECRCGDKKDVAPHSADDDDDCTTADLCSCGYAVREAKDHTPDKDDGNCETAVKCVECSKTAVASYTEHNDVDHDYVCDNANCQHTLDGAPKDENDGIDLPLVPNK